METPYFLYLPISQWLGFLKFKLCVGKSLQLILRSNCCITVSWRSRTPRGPEPLSAASRGRCRQADSVPHTLALRCVPLHACPSARVSLSRRVRFPGDRLWLAPNGRVGFYPLLPRGAKTM
ncbi:hypothetical protein HJG60_008170 [Phyllostomus discolor]|uniref:Uncharacterized protein n=1 Tax=Phyllostomus discolor TaxID=89673 RepID=A0A833Z6I9_9CHIR|nr:hypothetical protein HJG60_008170 [Phyllostomus discolor]